MADNVAYKSDATTTVATFRSDDDGTAHWQYVKLAYGPDNTQTIVDTTNALPVDLRSVNATGQSNTISTNNSTTSTLTASSNFTGTADDVSEYTTVTIQVDASHDSATDGMTFEFSNDNSNWDDVYTFTYTASEGARRFQFPVTAQYFRCNYTNGGTGQTHFRMQTILHSNNVLTSIHRASDNVKPDRSAQLVKSVLVAQQSGSGDFIPVASNASGKLQVAAEAAGAETPADGDATPTDAIHSQSFTMVYNGATWDFVREGGEAGSVLVDLGANNDVTIASVTPDLMLGTDFSAVLGTSNLIATAGSAALTIGVQVLGTDGTNARVISTNTSGKVQVTNTVPADLQAQVYGNIGSGQSDSGNPVKIGGIFNTTQPTFTTGQRGNLQISSRGAMRIVQGVEGFTATVDALGSTNIRATAASAALTTGIHALGTDGTNARILSTTTGGHVHIHDGGNSISVDNGGSDFGVSVNNNPVLGAGTNNIGDVDILSIAAGDNNIGNVDIVTMPNVTIGTALPAGTNNIGDVDILTMPALDRTTDNVGVAEDVNSLMNDTTVLTVKYANIANNTSGNNAIVAAVGGAKIRVLSIALMIEGATSVNTYWNDGTANLMGDSTHLIPLSNDGATGAAGFILPYNPKGWFETAAVNRPINLNLSGAVDVAGCLTYVEV